MNPIDPDNASVPPPDVTDDAIADPLETTATLRRRVLWLAVIGLLYAAGCALGVYFGLLYYRYESAEPPTRFHAKAVRLAQIGIVEKSMMTCAFWILARALFRYAAALKRAGGQRPSGDANTASLLKTQSTCWQAAIWTALLYMGWSFTTALVSAL